MLDLRSADKAMEFTFSEPAKKTYQLLVPENTRSTDPVPQWLSVADSESTFKNHAFGSTVILGLPPGMRVNPIIEGTGLKHARKFAPGVHYLSATNALAAAMAAQQLAGRDDVHFCHPDYRFTRQTSSQYARAPDDQLYNHQWHLEARGLDGQRLAPSINAREAWPISKGENVLIAIGDSSVELDHPDLAAATLGQPHFNFENQTTNSNPTVPNDTHGTAVAGLAGARGYNGIGVAGSAPMAKLAGWRMLSASTASVADMFQYKSNIVSVQNHSWSFGRKELADIAHVEKIALTNTITHGRGGKGVVLVRASGNARFENPGDVGRFPRISIVGDANDDAYLQHPGTILVGAVRTTGRVTGYSTPGACVLVAAGSGDDNTSGLVTTDRSESAGANAINCINISNCWNYAFNFSSFTGTSGSSPIIAGVAALIIGANTNLSYRDVQQIMLLSARHHDLADTDMQINGAGLRITHNVGYGVPDAGEAVRLAKIWPNRPRQQEVRYLAGIPTPIAIPDLGHIVRVSGNGVPPTLFRVPGRFPALSQHPDFDPGEWRPPNLESASLPVTFVGRATNDLSLDLTGRAALIERGDGDFIDKLNRVQAAGASFGIVFNNNTNAPELVSMGLQGINTYPSIFITKAPGEQIRDQSATNSELRVQLVKDGPRITFSVTNQMICERVAVRIRTTHLMRRNLSINLYSPSGTRSRLARSNPCIDTDSVVCHNEVGPMDWTYQSVMHFYESPIGDWTLQLVDDQEGFVGELEYAELIIKGTPITDSDADGLDDDWETTHFGNLNQSAQTDPDRDGYQNSREQVMGTNPSQIDAPFALKPELSVWNGNLSRLSWPGSAHFHYTVRAASSATGPYTTLTNVASQFPVSETFLSHTNSPFNFYRIESTPVQ